MKIVICASMAFSKKIIEIQKTLEKLHHSVEIPFGAEKYANGVSVSIIKSESLKNKIDHDAIKRYYNIIMENDAILVINEDKNNVRNYIGGNTFLEIGYAHVLDKKIFLLNPIPEMIYTTEIVAMKPIVINGDLKKIK